MDQDDTPVIILEGLVVYFTYIYIRSVPNCRSFAFFNLKFDH
jgi:hypothetical protein